MWEDARREREKRLSWVISSKGFRSSFYRPRQNGSSQSIKRAGWIRSESIAIESLTMGSICSANHLKWFSGDANAPTKQIEHNDGESLPPGLNGGGQVRKVRVSPERERESRFWLHGDWLEFKRELEFAWSATRRDKLNERAKAINVQLIIINCFHSFGCSDEVKLFGRIGFNM